MGYDGTNIKWFTRHIWSDDVVIGRVVYKPGGFCGPRIQRDFQLVTLHSGSCRVELDGEQHDIPTGYTCLLNPDHIEYYLFDQHRETNHSWCAISPRLMPEHMQAVLRDAHFMVPSSETIDKLLSLGCYLTANDNQHFRNVIESISFAIFNEYLNISTSMEQQKDVDASATKAMNYMEEHYPEQDCIIKCHEHAGVSRNTLINKFKDAVQMTPSKYLWKLRTEKGIALLTDTGLTINEIAYRCGFKNPFHFSRKVTELQGKSPREIRKQSWSG